MRLPDFSSLSQYLTIILLVSMPNCISTNAFCDMPGASGPGPLRVCPDNTRYFTDNGGKAIYLTGSHTWANLQEISGGSAEVFDFESHLDFLEKNNHNFIRLWVWEHTWGATWAPDTVKLLFGPPHIYPRTGPGTALDGLPRFDLHRFNKAFFNRLRSRVISAGERRIYVMIMLFQGFSVEKRKHQGANYEPGNPWLGHPFNQANNINGFDGDLNKNGQGEELHTLAFPKVTAIQKSYIRKVVDTVNDLDNVLYDISNESSKESTEWQYEMIDYIKEYEKSKTKQHPVVMTSQFRGGTNEDLFMSNADAVSPRAGKNRIYENDPPAADGSKVVILDTDHLWGIGCNTGWVWKSFLRGMNPIFMDPIEPLACYPSGINQPLYPEWVAVRKNMGYTLYFAKRINLVEMSPRGELVSSGYCLASPESEEAEYLIYLPEGGTVTVDLSATPGSVLIEWFDPAKGLVTDTWTGLGGKADKTFNAPFEGDAVLYIKRVKD